MANFNTDTYETKREIFKFCKPFFEVFLKPKAKFCSDMIFGMLGSQSVLISEISRALKETIDIKHVHKRLDAQLSAFSDEDIATLQSIHNDHIINMFGDRPIIVVDDSEITKNDGTKFEAIGRVRDASTDTIRDGYHLCEMVLLYGRNHHPVKIYSHIYSEKEKGFISVNHETAKGLNYCFELLGDKKAVFVFDRGYDKADWFKFIDAAGHDFIIRQKKNRNVIFQGKTCNIKELSESRKGKVKLTTKIKGEKVDLYASHIEVTILSQKKLKMTLVIIYGYGDTPMMLMTNRKVEGKEMVRDIMKLYILRWRIEEKFKFEKVVFDLEDIRVRSLSSINKMNQFMNYCILILAKLIEEKDNRQLVQTMIKRAQGLKKGIRMYYYRIAAGIKEILSHAKAGLQTYYKIEKRNNVQLQLKFKF